MNILLISVIEAFYVLYMLVFFKTKYNFATRIVSLITGNNSLLKHPIHNPRKPICMICKMGNILGVVFFILLILRGYVFDKIEKDNKNYQLYIGINYSLLFFGIFASFANPNVVVYMLPIFISEFIILDKLRKK